ncbi:MAG: pyridoxal phosphate-dependent aminotransferase family protein [Leeuwenhoekiella sp.]
MLPKKLQVKLDKRIEKNAFRRLCEPSELIDFSSNDYLGFAKEENIFAQATAILESADLKINGATGSRLISGNHKLYSQAEDMICDFHKSPAALIYNSGYDANLGFFSCVPQRGDVILYDEYIHASIRDGIQLGLAKSYKFKHNNLEDLEKKIKLTRNDDLNDVEIYVVTESVFSMDGDSPDLHKMSDLCKNYQARLIVDEAHSLGVFGTNGVGLIQQLHLENAVFVRLVTFGKAMGCHGAAILGGNDLKTYLVNYSRSFTYTTALSPHAVATIITSYKQLIEAEEESLALRKLTENIEFFTQKADFLGIKSRFIEGDSAIQSAIIPGNTVVRNMEKKLNEAGFEVKAILAPTVPEGQERLRLCLHSYNTKEEINSVLTILAQLINNIPAQEMV